MKAFLTLLLFSNYVFASLIIKEVKTTCKGYDCNYVERNLKTLRRSFYDIEHFRETIKIYAAASEIESFSYKLKQGVDSSAFLSIDVTTRKTIKSLQIKFTQEVDVELPELIPLEEEDFYETENVLATKALLKNTMLEKGYVDARVLVEKNINKNNIDLIFKINPARPIIVKEVSIESSSQYLKEILKRGLSDIRNKNFDLIQIRSRLERYRQLFISYGYYLSMIDMNVEYTAQRSVTLFIKIKRTKILQFSVTGNERFSDYEFKSFLTNTMLTYKRELSNDDLVNKIKEYYSTAAHLEPQVFISQQTFKNMRKEEVVNYKITVVENSRTQIEQISIGGISTSRRKHLLRLFYENAPEQVDIGLYQSRYIENFTSILEKWYLERGYVNVVIDKPKIKIKNNKSYIQYFVTEGVQAIVSKIKIKGVPEEFLEELYAQMNNKINKSFNPVIFKDDLDKVVLFLKNQGYFSASLVTKGNDVVVYKNSNSDVEITMDIDLGSKYRVDKIIIVGNKRTQDTAILRELVFEEGEYLSSSDITDSKINLLGLGLFRIVTIKPLAYGKDQADVLIRVEEKDFGLVEVAPGVRTDIGLKLSTDITYNNLDGLGKRVSLRAQVNQRFNLNSLDKNRRENANSLVEYNLNLNFSENYLFNTDVRFESSISTLRRRYFSFDADIDRVNFTFTKDFTRWFSANVTYQLETIAQFEATQEIDEGSFQIGSITPGITMDFRNNRINPTSGAWFNLSVEYANPYFLSQSNNELEIDYLKVVSRNRFYIPFKNGTFAMSLAAGYQRNNASDTRINDDGIRETKGYIPNIKVFRLNGIDVVRGYEDNEINRLESGEDISAVRIDNEAYMAVFKFEPRIFLSDSTMLGVFYDAGRVFVDSYDIEDLRSAAGVSFRYLTPVGSLNIEYGQKLLRKRNTNANLDSTSREAPGRLHVSIGFF